MQKDTCKSTSDSRTIRIPLENELSHGADLLRQGDRSGARETFEKVLKLAPKCWQAYLNLGDICLREKRYEKSGSYLNLALACNPRIPRAYYLKAKLLARKGQRAQAIQALGSALSLAPDDKEAERFLFLLSKHPDWRPRLEDSSVLIPAAEAAYNSGNMPVMFSELLNAAIAMSAEPTMQLVQIYCMLGHYEQACETLASLLLPREKLAQLDIIAMLTPWDMFGALPQEYYSWHRKNLARLKPKQHAPLLFFLKNTLEAGASRQNGAQFSTLERQIKKARGGMEFARIFTARHSLAGLHYAEAIGDYNGLIAAGYKGWYILCSLGEALFCAGDAEAGLTKFHEAQAGAGDNELGHVLAWEGEMRLILKQYSKALPLLEKSDSRQAPCWLGAACLETGRGKAALAHLKKAVAGSPLDAEARIWLAEAYRRDGEPEKAMKEFMAAEKIERDNFWAHLGIAMLCSASGDKNNAKIRFSAAARIWPELIQSARGEGKARTADLDATMGRVVELCGGFRRTDKYLLPLVLASAG